MTKHKFIELGKSTPQDPLRFEHKVLAYSDSMFSPAPDYYAYFEKVVLKFPATTVFCEGPKKYGQGNIAAANIYYLNSSDPKDGFCGYFFTQIHRRREAEFRPGENRPFNQYRATFLTAQDIFSYLREEKAVFRSFLFGEKSTGSNTPSWGLRMYSDTDISDSLAECDVVLQPLILEDEKLCNLAKIIVNALLNNQNQIPHPRVDAQAPIIIGVSMLSLEDQINLLDLVQYYVYPFIGPLTFSIDDVTTRKVHVRFLSDQQEAVTRELNTPIDYFKKIKSVQHDELYSPSLCLYLSEGVNWEDALELSRIENGSPIVFDSLRDVIYRQFSLLHKLKKLNVFLDILPKDITRQLLLNSGGVPEFSINTLEYFSGKQDFPLETYFEYHLSVPAPKRTKDIYKYLGIVLYRNISDNKYRVSIHPEWTPEIVHYISLLIASNPQANVESLFLLLLTDPSYDALQLIGNVKENRAFSLALIKSLQNKDLVWEPQVVYSASKLLNIDTSSYHILVEKLLDPSQRDLVKRDSDELITFCGLGLGFAKLADTNRNKAPNSLLSFLRSDVSGNFRAMCLDISKTAPRFAAWWVLSELVYDGETILYQDYKQIIEHYKTLANLPVECEAFLLQGKRVPGFSLWNSCNELAENKYSISLVLMKCWLDCDLCITHDDLEKIFTSRPQKFDFIAKVFDSQSQQPSLRGLHPSLAAKLLQDTRQEARKKYFINGRGDDILLKSLFCLSRINQNFLFELLVKEDQVFFEVAKTWNKYKSICNDFMTRLGARDDTEEPVCEVVIVHELLEAISSSQLISRSEVTLFRKLVTELAGFRRKGSQPPEEFISRLSNYVQSNPDGSLKEACLFYFQKYAYSEVPKMPDETKEKKQHEASGPTAIDISQLRNAQSTRVHSPQPSSSPVTWKHDAQGIKTLIIVLIVVILLSILIGVGAVVLLIL